ncbi:MAG: hypothetical protein ACYDD4_11785 [Acidimicrobiales bacterium]
MTSDPEAPLSPALALPPEPLELLSKLRGVLVGDGVVWEEAFGPGLGVADVLWSSWGDELAPLGLTSVDALVPVVAGMRRELWFWVLGDREWPPVAASLAGRIRRRIRSS